MVVITLGGDALAHPNLTTIIHDLALLASLGVRLVVAFGARPQIRERLDEAGETSGYQGRLRVTTEAQLPLVLEAVGRLRALLESRMSMGLANSPMHGAQMRVASGNWLTARPIGVINGVDHGYTGRVRRVDVASIRQQLDSGQVVLLPPMGYSATGDAFNLSHEEVAGEAAAALEGGQADPVQRSQRDPVGYLRGPHPGTQCRPGPRTALRGAAGRGRHRGAAGGGQRL